MLPTNTMRYGLDRFTFRRQALLRSRQPLDFTYETSVVGFEISGTEPEGTARRVIFEIDGKLYKFSNGGLDEYEDRGEFGDILANGNTVGELRALAEIAGFVGKRVYPIIALDAPYDAPIMPKIRIGVRVNSFNDVYTRTDYSPVYELKRAGDTCKVISIVADKVTNGNAVGTIKCRLEHALTGWGDWIFLNEAANAEARAVQFQIQQIVTTLDGSDEVEVKGVTVNHTTDGSKLSGETMEIVTAAQEYYSDLGTCYALIKTSELVDCEIKAFVSFAAPNVRRENVNLGVGTGEAQTITLMHNGVVEKNIAQDTIHVAVNGRTASGYYFDTQNSTLTVNAENGAEVSADYEVGADEEWREMEFDFTSGDNGVHSTRFTFRLSDSDGKRISAVKFRLIKKAGKVENVNLGKGSGKEQIFALEHRAVSESIVCTGNWRYDETAQLLRVVAPINANILLSYDWIGEMPAVRGYIVGWTPKL